MLAASSALAEVWVETGLLRQRTVKAVIRLERHTKLTTSLHYRCYYFVLSKYFFEVVCSLRPEVMLLMQN